MKTWILILLGVILVTIFFLYENRVKNDTDREALVNLDLQLTGVVQNLDIPPGHHAFGIITMIILESNIKEYTPQPNQEFYYCVIKNGVAEIYDHAVGYHIGDTLVIDTKEKIISLKNGDKGLVPT